MVLSAEQVRVVLRETAHAGEAAEFAGLFPAIHGAELREAHGQIAIRLGRLRVDADVVRAVHRLQQEAIDEVLVLHHAVFGDAFHAGAFVDLLAHLGRHRFNASHDFSAGAAGFGALLEVAIVDDGAELRLLVVREVAAGLVEFELADVRREDLRVALLAQLFADEVLQLLTHDRALGHPEDEALADLLVDGEEAEFAAQLAMVALLRFLELREVGVQFFLGREGGAVEALKLRLGLVAQVEGRADGHELHVFALAAVADVWAGAEVDELAVLEGADLLAFGDLFEQVELEHARVAWALGEAAEATAFREFDRFLARDAFPLELLVLLRDLLHLRLDLLEVIRRDAVLHVEVVVEAVLHRRAVGELGIGPDAQDRGGHDMGTGVTQTINV